MRFLRPETQKSAMGPECFCRQCFFSNFEGHFREKCVSGLIFRFLDEKVGPDPTFAFFRAKSVPGRPGRPQGENGTPESLIFLRNYWCFGPGRVGMRFFCHFPPKINFPSHFRKLPPKWGSELSTHVSKNLSKTNVQRNGSKKHKKSTNNCPNICLTTCQ